MSLDPLQIEIVKVLKARRSRTSFVGGSTVFNASFPRRSADMDVYIEDAALSDIANGDVAALRVAGFDVSVEDQFYGLVIEARVSRDDQSTLIEWNEADRERFFPVIESPLFGWTLHPIDLAVQKVVAAATRRAARDAVDVLLLSSMFVPLAALAIAAPGKLSGSSPTGILDRVLRNGIGHAQQDFETLLIDRESMPFDMGRIKIALADVVDQAIEEITRSCDQARPGFVYCTPGTTSMQTPRNDVLEQLQARGISERGVIPIIDRPLPRLGGTP